MTARESALSEALERCRDRICSDICSGARHVAECQLAGRLLDDAAAPQQETRGPVEAGYLYCGHGVNLDEAPCRECDAAPPPREETRHEYTVDVTDIACLRVGLCATCGQPRVAPVHATRNEEEK